MNKNTSIPIGKSFSGPLANDSTLLSACSYERRQESSQFENIETKPRKSLVFVLKTFFPNILFYLLIMLVTLLLLIVLNKYYKLTDEPDFDHNKVFTGWSNQMQFGPIYNRCNSTNISHNLGPQNTKQIICLINIKLVSKMLKAFTNI